jgi:hypothetical protein
MPSKEAMNVTLLSVGVSIVTLMILSLAENTPTPVSKQPIEYERPTHNWRNDYIGKTVTIAERKGTVICGSNTWAYVIISTAKGSERILVDWNLVINQHKVQ